MEAYHKDTWSSLMCFSLLLTLFSKLWSCSMKKNRKEDKEN